MTQETIAALMEDAHKTAVDHGWYTTEPKDDEVRCNLLSELMEAWNEYTHNRGLAEIYLTRDEMGKDKENGVPVELADFVIRCLDYIAHCKISADLVEWTGIGMLDYARKGFASMICGVAEVISAAQSREALIAACAMTIYAVESWCQAHDINLPFVIRRKMAYNRTRPYRHGGKRV